MIGALRYFNPRYWASRYWPKIGAASTDPTVLCHESIVLRYPANPAVVLRVVPNPSVTLKYPPNPSIVLRC